MAINFRSNTIIKNLRVGPLSGGGGGGGGISPLVVGAHGYDSFDGSAYVFDSNNLSSAPTILTPFSGEDSGRQFGNVVAASSDYIAIGAHYTDNGSDVNTGAVYIYSTSNLSATPTRILGNFGASSYFGSAAAITGNSLLIGTPGATAAGNKVFVYDLTNLANSPTVLSSGGSNVEFGRSVAAYGNKAVVGEPFHDGQGAAYVFDLTNLSASPTRLLSPTHQQYRNDKFGYSVAISGDFVVVGAPFRDPSNAQAGRAYVYDLNNLSSTPTTLTAFDSSNWTQYGTMVAVENNNIVIGTSYSQYSSTNGVYVYDASNLASTPTKFSNNDLSSIAIYNNQLVIGSSLYDGVETDSGRIQIYDTTNLAASPTTITPSTESQNLRFGHSVSLG